MTTTHDRVRRLVVAARSIIDRMLYPLWHLTAKVWGNQPRRPERNPLEFCLLAILAISTAPIAIGTQALPNSLAQTPDLFGQTAAICIVFGGALSVVGLSWREKNNRLVIEQLGMAFAGFGLLCYGMALINAASWTQASIAASLTWGLSVGTGARYAQIAWFQRQHHERQMEGRAYALVREGQSRADL